MAPRNAGMLASDEMEMAGAVTDGAGDGRVEVVECACCGMAEDCTPTYIEQTREVFQGRWVCGLCGVAVAERMRRGPPGLAREEALEAHIELTRGFNGTVRLNPKLSIALSMQDIARKISERRSAGGGMNGLARAMSCVARFDVCVEQSQSR